MKKIIEQLPTDETIENEAAKYYQHSCGLMSKWFEIGAKWACDDIKKKLNHII